MRPVRVGALSVTRRAELAPSDAGAAQRLDPVEDRLGDLLLGGERDLRARASRSTIVTSLRSRVEADLGSETSLKTIASTPLRSSLLARPLDRLARRARRRSRRASGRRGACAASAGEDVLGRLEAQLEAAAALARRSSPSARVAGRKSAGAAAISRTSAVGELAPHAPRRARRRSRRRRGATPAGAGRATLAATSVTSAPRRAAALGERQAHAAARAVADEAHRVDRLAGAAGGDQHAQAVPGPARPPGSSASTAASSRSRLGQPADAVLAAGGERALVGLDHLDAALAQRRQVRLGRRVARTCGRSSPGRRARGAVQARNEVVSIESAIPAASLAIVFADAGATRKASALATTSRWPIGSCSGSRVAGEGAAQRVALELVDRAPARRRSPRRRRRRRSAARPGSSARERRGPPWSPGAPARAPCRRRCRRSRRAGSGP